LPPAAKKKPSNDIIKKNMAKTKVKAAAPDSVNIEVNKGAMNYTIGNKGPSMFSAKIDRPAATVGATVKKKTARELVFDEMKEYHKKPNAKKLKDLREKCASLNFNFDQLFNKAKEEQMKEKSSKKKKNPTGLDDKLTKRIAFGNKLIENLMAA
jgi:tRNA U34 2-thiouridine synthase MnmA/TrmU